MKKFIRKVSVFVVIILSLTVFPLLIIDPYNVVHWKNIRNNGIEPNKNYIKTKYIIENPNKFESYIFGSSRVSSIHVENITSEHVYNMTYSQGVPAEHLETIQELIENDVNIKTVYIGVDNVSYTMDRNSHLGTPLHSSYKELQNMETFLTVYTNPKMNLESLKFILQKKKLSGQDTFYSYGWDIDYNVTSKYDWDNPTPSIGDSYLMDNTLEDIRKIKKLCDDNGIEMVIWTNPMYKITYEESVKHNYLDFLEQLAQITDYYNFSGLNDMTLDSNNYVDTSHYKAELGDMMINVIWNNVKYDDLYKQGFGWYVTEENIDELISVIK